MNGVKRGQKWVRVEDPFKTKRIVDVLKDFDDNYIVLTMVNGNYEVFDIDSFKELYGLEEDVKDYEMPRLDNLDVWFENRRNEVADRIAQQKSQGMVLNYRLLVEHILLDLLTYYDDLESKVELIKMIARDLGVGDVDKEEVTE